MLTIRLQWLLKYLLCLSIEEIRLLVVLLEIVTHFTTPDHVDIICLISLLKEFTASRFDRPLYLLE